MNSNIRSYKIFGDISMISMANEKKTTITPFLSCLIVLNQENVIYWIFGGKI